MPVSPGIMMLLIWGGAMLMYMLLPFGLVNREFTFYGVLVFITYLGCFVLGSFLVPERKPLKVLPSPPVMSRYGDYLLTSACLIALVAAIIQVVGNAMSFDLGDAYAERSKRATALLKGEQSNSSIYFQIMFLTYPAAFVYIARSIIYSINFNKVKLLVLGVLPVVAASAAMGGRAPLLYAIVIIVFSLITRRYFLKCHSVNVSISIQRKVVYLLGFLALICSSLYYFSAVFLVRVEDSVGGIAEMFVVAEQNWGVSFKGGAADLLSNTMGEEFLYLVFVFSWYLLQGFFMGNVIFSSYDGPAQFGIYGLDLVSALMRRLDGQAVAENFDFLMDIGVYGFLPSAFGSLYVDFKFWGLLIAFLWGNWAGWTFYKIKTNASAAWYIMAPFVMCGILFSLINTPLGFTNGFVTHIWMFAFFIFSAEKISTVYNK